MQKSTGTLCGVFDTFGVFACLSHLPGCGGTTAPRSASTGPGSSEFERKSSTALALAEQAPPLAVLLPAAQLIHG